jgi:hypothetical protein
MSYIKNAFLAAAKTHIAHNTVPGKPDWVKVEAIFNGNVSKNLIVLADGSDVEKAVKDVLEMLQRRYLDWKFHFDGFVGG